MKVFQYGPLYFFIYLSNPVADNQISTLTSCTCYSRANQNLNNDISAKELKFHLPNGTVECSQFEP